MEDKNKTEQGKAPQDMASNTSDQTGIAIVSQNAILPGTIKPRHVYAGNVAPGDLYYGDGTNFKQITVGTTGQVLTVAASIPTWATAAVAPTDGWVATSVVLTYSSADSPTFVASTASDLTALIGVGMRLKLTQTTVKYFLVTAIDASTITLYGGTDYTLANAAISAVSYSAAKTPFGFNASPTKWTQTFSDTVDRSQATPTSSTWYNVGTSTLAIPIGVWSVEYEVSAAAAATANGQFDLWTTLSTANNSVSDVDFSCYTVTQSSSADQQSVNSQFYRRKVLTLASKTSYYLNTRSTTAALSVIVFQGGESTTFIRAVSALL